MRSLSLPPQVVATTQVCLEVVAVGLEDIGPQLVGVLVHQAVIDQLLGEDTRRRLAHVGAVR